MGFATMLYAALIVAVEMVWIGALVYGLVRVLTL